MKNTVAKLVLMALLMITTKTFVWPQDEIIIMDSIFSATQKINDIEIRIVTFTICVAAQLHYKEFNKYTDMDKVVTDISELCIPIVKLYGRQKTLDLLSTKLKLSIDNLYAATIIGLIYETRISK